MLRIGVCQLAGYKSPFESLKKIEYFCNKAQKYHIDLVVFPEMAMGVIDKANTPKLLSSNFSTYVTKLIDISKKNKIDIITTAWEPEKQKPYNSAIFVKNDGSTSILYRKLHLFDSLGYNESNLVLPGDNPPEIIDYMGFKISVSICYDLRFPELYRYQAQKGTEVSIICSGWYMGKYKEDHFITLLKARAIENTMYVLCSNLCGSNFCGRSSIFDPFGIQLCDAGEEENLIYVSIKKDRIEKIRKTLPCLKHRQKDILN